MTQKKTVAPRRRVLMAPDDRRHQLLDAATWVFARKGYRRSGVSDIIARAGVARGTFYLYFTSKEQVFLAIVEAFHARIKQALANVDSHPAVPADGPRGLLRASFRQWLDLIAANRDAATVILKEATSIDPRFEKGLADLRHSALVHFAERFHRMQQLGAVNASLSPEFIAHVQLGVFDELLNAFVLRDPHADLDALAAQLADFEWNGIQPREA
jgi:AcrR family transcriptional regulator